MSLIGALNILHTPENMQEIFVNLDDHSLGGWWAEERYRIRKKEIPQPENDQNRTESPALHYKCFTPIKEEAY